MSNHIDAIADAATLLEVLRDVPSSNPMWKPLSRLIGASEFAIERIRREARFEDMLGTDAAYMVRVAARRAFEAIPELRG